MAQSVGVVMCVHNGWPYLPEAIESVLRQDRPVDRFVIVDDASTDQTTTYLADITDSRVRVLRNNERRGPGSAAQRGVDACDCDLIARLDADDVAESWRVRSQVAYMDAHPEVVMVCTSANLIDEQGEVTGRYEVARQGAVLHWELLFRNPVVQSTVMYRRRAFESVGGYSELEVAEDYDLWSRLARSGGRIGSLVAPAVRLRKHEAQASERRSEDMLETAVDIATANIEGLTATRPERGLVRCLVSAGVDCSKDALGAVELLAEITRRYLGQRRVGLGARREIRARECDRTLQMCDSAGLDPAQRSAALRTCMFGAGYVGLTTYEGARAVYRLLLPRRPAVDRESSRHRDRP